MNAVSHIARAHRPVVIQRDSAYDWRTEDCSACDQDRHCEFCVGTGEVHASCVECDRIVPLDSEGTCCKCVDASILPLEVFAAKYHPRVSVSA